MFVLLYVRSWGGVGKQWSVSSNKSPWTDLSAGLRSSLFQNSLKPRLAHPPPRRHLFIQCLFYSFHPFTWNDPLFSNSASQNPETHLCMFSNSSMFSGRKGNHFQWQSGVLVPSRRSSDLVLSWRSTKRLRPPCRYCPHGVRTRSTCFDCHPFANEIEMCRRVWSLEKNKESKENKEQQHKNHVRMHSTQQQKP